jgi:hypothetical protein
MTTIFHAASSRHESLFVGRCPCWPLVSRTHTGLGHDITGRSHRRLVESLGPRKPPAAGDLLASYRSCAFRLCDWHHGKSGRRPTGCARRVMESRADDRHVYRRLSLQLLARQPRRERRQCGYRLMGLLQLQSSRAEDTHRQGEAQVGMRVPPYHKRKRDHVWMPFCPVLDNRAKRPRAG